MRKLLFGGSVMSFSYLNALIMANLCRVATAVSTCLNFLGDINELRIPLSDRQGEMYEYLTAIRNISNEDFRSETSFEMRLFQAHRPTIEI
jgi:hypothetical protein